MNHVMPRMRTSPRTSPAWTALSRTSLSRTLILAGLAAGLTCSASAQMRQPDPAAPKSPPTSPMSGNGMATTTAPEAAVGILPSGFGEAVDRDVARLRTATAPFKSLDKAVAAGYAKDVKDCIEHQPHGAMGYHHNNKSLMDATLEVEKPEVLVYEKLADGTYRLNGVEYLVPISAWKSNEPPTIMGQKLNKAEKLGIWYLHVWNWQASPNGLFSDWNPRVKCS
jgi:hypothetical protein